MDKEVEQQLLDHRFDEAFKLLHETTATCFDICVNNLRIRAIERAEGDCLISCAHKLVNHHQRCAGTYTDSVLAREASREEDMRNQMSSFMPPGFPK